MEIAGFLFKKGGYMTVSNNIILIFLLLIAVNLFVLYTMVFGGFDVGCHIVGTEINGNNSIEYMMMGNC
jgi:hypothetical protein